MRRVPRCCGIASQNFAGTCYLDRPDGPALARGKHCLFGYKNSFSACDCAFRQIVALSQLERSEEHTSELQSHSDLVCRLLLEKKKNHFVSQSFPVHSP